MHKSERRVGGGKQCNEEVMVLSFPTILGVLYHQHDCILTACIVTHTFIGSDPILVFSPFNLAFSCFMTCKITPMYLFL